MSIENDDFPALWRPEIVGYAIHKKMVASLNTQSDNIFARVIIMAGVQLSANLQGSSGRRPVIRWKPQGVRFAADPEGLFDIENEESEGRLNGIEYAIIVRHDVQIGDALEPLLYPFQSGRELKIRAIDEIHRSDAVKGWLH